jgi:hypothetical protein
MDLMFRVDECGAIFSFSYDNGAFMRVYGCNAKSCLHDGHGNSCLTSKGLAKPGSYETVCSQKVFDGQVKT